MNAKRQRREIERTDERGLARKPPQKEKDNKRHKKTALPERGRHALRPALVQSVRLIISRGWPSRLRAWLRLISSKRCCNTGDHVRRVWCHRVSAQAGDDLRLGHLPWASPLSTPAADETDFRQVATRRGVRPQQIEQRFSARSSTDRPSTPRTVYCSAPISRNCAPRLVATLETALITSPIGYHKASNAIRIETDLVLLLEAAKREHFGDAR